MIKQSFSDVKNEMADKVLLLSRTGCQGFEPFIWRGKKRFFFVPLF